MREIKFRVWDGTLMLPAESIQFDTETVEVIIPCDAFGCEGHPIEYDFGNVVLMQYTGLCDKNGKEIYEGDIIRENDCGDIWEWVVKFSETYGGFYIHHLPTNETFYFDDMLYVFEHGEVIGNIYENPDFLAEVSA
jgi:uncharacterized phage protein (TIGR01671 family)